MGNPNDYYDYKSLDDRRFYDDVQLCALCGTWVNKENVRMFSVYFDNSINKYCLAWCMEGEGAVSICEGCLWHVSRNERDSKK